MSPEGLDPQEVVYGDTYKPRKKRKTAASKPSKLDDLLRAVHDEGIRGQSFDHNKGINTARAQILALIEEVIIGEDDVLNPVEAGKTTKEEWIYRNTRNELRAEMRLRKDAL